MVNWRPLWSELVREEIVLQDSTMEGDEAKMRSIRVAEVFVVHVGLDTI